MEMLRRWQHAHPKYILLISLLLILTMFLSAFFELSHSRREINHVMEEEAATLMEAISQAGANAIAANLELEGLLEDKLLSLLQLLNRLEQRQRLSQQELRQIATENGLELVAFFDRGGHQELVSRPDFVANADSVRQLVQPIISGEAEMFVIGLTTQLGLAAPQFAAAAHRGSGGFIIASMAGETLLQFRKEVGVGVLMQQISRYPGIEFIVLQDEDGIILASEGISRLPNIRSDAFLMEALQQSTLSSRLIEFGGQQIFECVRSFIFKGETLGLFRIGLKTDHLKQASNRMQRRLIIMSGVLGLFLLIGVNFLTINQNYQTIRQAYRRIQTYSSSILEHMADAVIAIDRDQRISLFNHAASELFGVAVDQVIGQPCQLCFSANLVPLLNALQTGVTVKDSEHDITINGRRLIISISTSLLKNEQGTIESAFAVIKNLTEKRQLEETLRRKEKLTAMGQLASGVAHEIRNPLNAIGMITQRLAREFVPQSGHDEYRELTKIVVSEVRRINDIIQQFLKFARPPKLHLAATNVNLLIENTVKLMASQAQEKKIEIITSLNSTPVLMIDQNQMQQALLNILQNAIEAIPGEGKITISTAVTNEREVGIRIADSGIGMNSETQSKIFNLYYTTKPQGTGLGLSLVHQIISQHEGRIEVESAVGKGSTFSIYLPI
ncbi:MAG: ATP-binding protein [candidate division KSB1 bacterium]|nr:ATP-binding protein [candidate division KSB1 bacterium]